MILDYFPGGRDHRAVGVSPPIHFVQILSAPGKGHLNFVKMNVERAKV
jgi:hypothetical protein